jgi:DNA-binding MarR family transcriptional regulator
MEDQTTPSQLASYSGVARPAISRLLKTMMDRGFIERQSKGEDGRVSEVVLTELGLSTMKECHILVRELNSHYSSKLDEETFEQFMQTINVLLEGEDETLMRL